MLGLRDVSGQRQRIVEVLGLQYVVAAGDLGALDERSVGDYGGIGPPVIRTPSATGNRASPARIADAALA